MLELSPQRMMLIAVLAVVGCVGYLKLNTGRQREALEFDKQTKMIVSSIPVIPPSGVDAAEPAKVAVAPRPAPAARYATCSCGCLQMPILAPCDSTTCCDVV